MSHNYEASEPSNEKLSKKRNKKLIGGVALATATGVLGVGVATGAPMEIAVHVNDTLDQRAEDRQQDATEKLDPNELYSDMEVVDAGVYEATLDDYEQGSHIYVDVKKTPTEDYQKALDGDFNGIPKHFKHYPSRKTEMTPEDAARMQDRRVYEAYWNTRLVSEQSTYHGPLNDFDASIDLGEGVERFVIQTYKLPEGEQEIELEYAVSPLSIEQTLPSVEMDEPIGKVEVSVENGLATEVRVTEK